MNLILSDVEETIMILDVEGAPEGTVNVRPQCMHYSASPIPFWELVGCKTKNGDVIC